MKRLLILLLAVFLLTACAGEQSPEATEPTPAETTEDPRAGLPEELALVDDHPVAAQNGNAVTVYDLSQWGVGSFDAVYPCQSGMAAHEASGVLWVFDPQNGYVTASYQDIYEIVGVDAQGFATARSDTELTTYRFGEPDGERWTLPGDIQGKPAVDTENGQIYYCTPGQVFALDMSTGLTRVLRKHSLGEALPQKVSGQILELLVGEQKLLISTEDGRTVFEEGRQTLHGLYGNKRLITEVEDGVTQHLLLEGEKVLCSLDLDPEAMLPTPDLSGVILRQADKLSYYTLPDGECAAQIQLKLESPWIYPQDDRVLILDENILYVWDLKATSQKSSDHSIYKPYYTAESPDTQGLAACKERALQMETTYGIKINIFDDVPADIPMTMEPEYRVDVIRQRLDSLEAVLDIFPADFLKVSVQNDWIYVDLVKSIQQEKPFVQFWHDGGCHIAVTLAADMAEAFYTGAGWAVDTRILGNSRDLEYWEDLNPQGFAYDLDFNITDKRDDTQYLDGEDPYFADKRSMAFPTEDRARIFYYALTPGNEKLFSGSVLQRKLEMLCEGIREAYGLKKFTEALPWEQYLEESMAYEP